MDTSSLPKDFWLNLTILRDSLVNKERLATLQKQCNNGAEADAVDNDLPTREEVIRRLEAVITSVIEGLANGEAPYITYRRRDTWDNVRYQEGLGLELVPNSSETVVRFDSVQSIRKFALTLRVLAIIHGLLQTNTYSTKRDMYYQDTQSFGTQTTVDSIVDNITCMLRVSRARLHVLATSKGCVAGDLRYTEADGNMVDCRHTNTGVMIPNHIEALENIQSNANFVLVVEKDATFQRLLDEGVCSKLSPCVLVTGKGFPDVNTRLLVRRLWDNFQVPVFVLVDADPHGIEILMVYKFGSRSMSFEASTLAIPVARWIGVWPSDIKRLQMPQSGLVPLTEADLTKAEDLLRRPYISSQPAWQSEVKQLIDGGVKAEIQTLDAISPRFLADVYLPNKICYGGWV